MSGPSEKALQEFLSEAQEILDSLNRDVLSLDEGRLIGGVDPDIVNNAFRSVHSLKGLSGLFGVARMTNLAHRLENLLDGLRLGRVELGQEVFDLLFEAIELFQRIIAETAKGTADDREAPRIDRLIDRLDNIGEGKTAPSAPSPKAATAAATDDADLSSYDIDPSLLSVLTEYEEHRLKENIRLGRPLCRVHASFPLMSIDQDLEALKKLLKPVGEVITYLPAAESASDTSIEIDVVVGATKSIEAVKAALAQTAVTISEIPIARKEGAPPLGALPAASRAELTDATEAAPASIKSVAQTVRVDIRKLDTLMNVVGELAMTRAGLQAVFETARSDPRRSELSRALHHEMRALARKLDELQQGILEVRMVPLSQMLDKLSRVVRKISRDAGKDVRLVISGGDTELDKLIVEELSDPLMHIIRNSIDHGIETEAARTAAGKPRVGTIPISAEQRGNHVVLEVSDDGGGLDEEKLLEKAVARGMLERAQARELSQREVFNLMFLPGVSTKDVADHMSGRGVGMDVVKTNIARLSGIIDIDSHRGKGTRLTITLPVTLAIIKALVIRVAGRTFAIPLNSVLESLRLGADNISTIERREVMLLRGQTLPLVRLDQLFRLSRGDAAPPQRHFVVVVGLAQHRLGVLVDELCGQQDIIIKSLGPSLDGVPGVAGATELGGQKTVLVLDVGSIVEESLSVQVDAA